MQPNRNMKASLPVVAAQVGEADRNTKVSLPVVAAQAGADPVVAALAAEPILEVMEDFVPEALHGAAWKACSGKGWFFGHGSHDGDWSRFWKMDLDGEATFDAIWEHVRPRCEALAGAPLRVIRQYANGHTYGLGGQPHLDDVQPGSYTLLYYPNPEWKDGWDGETVYYDEQGEIALAVRPRPNRAVFFDSRILHAGRAPSRLCPALRVTVAYKLQVADVAAAVSARVEQPVEQAPGVEVPSGDASCEELAERRDGATRVYNLRIAATVVDEAVAEQLARLGKSVRLPGFRPGKIPPAVLLKRYGAQARVDAIKRAVAEAAQKTLPKDSVAGSFALVAGAEAGDVECQATVTYLPDLAEADFSTLSIERLTAASEDLKAAELSEGEAAELFRHHWKLQVMDHLDAAYPIPILPFQVEREFARIWKAAEEQSGIPAGGPERDSLVAEFRAIAERRLRLGMVVAELARRGGISARDSAELEDKVVDLLAGRARVKERRASVAELRELAGAE